MNERQVSILARFINEPGSQITSTMLADHFKCCERTVRSDIASVNEWLCRHHYGLAIIGERGRGFHLEQASDDAQQVLKRLALNTPSTTSYVELFINGMAELLLTGRRHTIASLAKFLFVSRSVLNRELKRWDSMLEVYGLTLTRGKWLEVTGPEERIRMFFVSYLYLLAPDTTRRQIAPAIIGEQLDDIVDALKLLIPDSTRYTRNALEQIALMYACALKRVSHGHAISDQCIERLGPGHASSTRMLCREIAKVLPLPLNEHLFIAACTNGAAMPWSPTILKTYRPENADAELMADALSVELRRQGATVPTDRLSGLAIIIDKAINRMESHVPVVDLDGNATKSRLLGAHATLMCAISRSQIWQEHPLYGEDYTRITMLLAEQLAPYMQNPTPRAALVVNSDIATSMFVQTRLRRILAMRVELVCVITEWQVQELDSDEIDFLISLDYLETDMPYVRISSLLDTSDVDRIERHLAALDQQRLRSNEPVDVLPERSLSARTGSRLIMQLHQHATADNTWSGSIGEFRRMITGSWFIWQNLLLAVIMCPSSVRTAVARFTLGPQVFVRGMEVNEVQILYIRMDEERGRRVAALDRFARLAELPLT